MKKAILIELSVLALVLCAVTAYAVDSTDIQNAIHAGVKIISVVDPTIIPGVPNEITGGIISAIAAVIIRFIEKRKLKKQHKADLEAARFKY